MMTLDEFIKFRDTRIKDREHKKIVELFYPYLSSVTGNLRLLPDINGQLIGIDLSQAIAVTGCFNGINDGSTAPYDNVDFYLKFSNDIRVFVYGRELPDKKGDLQCNEYVVCVLADTFDNTVRGEDRHIFVLA